MASLALRQPAAWAASFCACGQRSRSKSRLEEMAKGAGERRRQRSGKTRRPSGSAANSAERSDLLGSLPTPQNAPCILMRPTVGGEGGGRAHTPLPVPFRLPETSPLKTQTRTVHSQPSAPPQFCTHARFPNLLPRDTGRAPPLLHPSFHAWGFSVRPLEVHHLFLWHFPMLSSNPRVSLQADAPEGRTIGLKNKNQEDFFQARKDHPPPLEILPRLLQISISRLQA